MFLHERENLNVLLVCDSNHILISYAVFELTKCFPASLSPFLNIMGISDHISKNSLRIKLGKIKRKM